ncbi:Uncharacterised protein [Mycobacteroides abscessus]|nr:Uncharacterised protein [Mycobacteroides abscessus]
MKPAFALASHCTGVRAWSRLACASTASISPSVRRRGAPVRPVSSRKYPSDSTSWYCSIRVNGAFVMASSSPW